MATQLNHVAIHIEETKTQTQVPSIPPEGSSYGNSISKPFFKTDSIPKEHEAALTKTWANNSLTNQIFEQIEALEIHQQRSASWLHKTCVLVATKSSASNEDVEERNDSEEESLNVISKLFDIEASLTIKKIRHWNLSTSRNFYPRLTPPDI